MRSTSCLSVRRRYKTVPYVAAKVLRHGVQMKRLSLRAWMPILPWPVWPLAGHALLGQHVVVESMLVLRVALGNVLGGVWLDPRLYHKDILPRLSGELPVIAIMKEKSGWLKVSDKGWGLLPKNND